MFIENATNLITNSVRRSGTQLETSRSRNDPLLRTVTGRWQHSGYKHLTPTGWPDFGERDETVCLIRDTSHFLEYLPLSCFSATS